MPTSARAHTQHYIVPTTMSRSTFRRTKMMARYDTHSCDGSFGNGLVDAWRRTGTECCQPGEALADSPDASSIRCHLIHQVGGVLPAINRTYTVLTKARKLSHAATCYPSHQTTPITAWWQPRYPDFVLSSVHPILLMAMRSGYGCDGSFRPLQRRHCSSHSRHEVFAHLDE